MNQRDKFEAVVSNNQDPEKRGRVRVTCRALVAEGVELPEWIEPSFPYAGDGAGWFFVPPPGTPVEIEAIVSADGDDSPGQAFIANPDYRWTACLYAGPDAVPAEFRQAYGARLGIKTPAGMLLLFDESATAVVFAGFTALRLGSEQAAQPFVLGTVFQVFASALLDAIAAHVHTESAVAGGQTSPPTNAATFVALKASPIDDGAVLSSKVFAE